MLVKGYHINHKAKYHRLFPNEISINIGMFNENGNGCTYEFHVKWNHICKELIATMVICDDAYKAFTEMPEFFKALSDFNKKYISPNEMEELLKNLGYNDLTCYECEV